MAVAQCLAGLDVVEDAMTDLVDNGTLVRDALRMAREIGRPGYDCLYLALAAREQTVVVTADLRLVGKLQTTPFAHFVRPLAAVS